MKFELFDAGADDERSYFAIAQLFWDDLEVVSHALLGIEITSKNAIDGPGIYIQIAWINFRFSWPVFLLFLAAVILIIAR